MFFDPVTLLTGAGVYLINLCDLFSESISSYCVNSFCISVLKYVVYNIKVKAKQNKAKESRVWWPKSVISALRRLKQEGCLKFKARLQSKFQSSEFKASLG